MSYLHFFVGTKFRVGEEGEQENNIVLWNQRFTDGLPMREAFSVLSDVFFKQARQLTGNQVDDEMTHLCI